MNASFAERFDRWMTALEARHLADLSFSEVARALRALSSAYVERRSRLREGAALSGAGKRAAFALFYAPLHFLLVHEVVTRLDSSYTAVRTLLDIGCGTGASSAGWSMACDGRLRVTGMDRHPWAIEEARRTFADLDLAGRFRVEDLARTIGPGPEGPRDGARTRRPRNQRHPDAILLAYTANEIADAGTRDRLFAWLLDSARRGSRVVIVEPLARSVAPWWGERQRQFEMQGGCAREWRFRLPLPPLVQKLDRAAGLDHRELTCRTLTI